MGIKKPKKIKKEYIPVIIAIVLLIVLIIALIYLLFHEPKEVVAEIDPNQHIQEELEVDNSQSSCQQDTLTTLYELASKVTVDTEIIQVEEEVVDGDDYPTPSYYPPQITFSNVEDHLILHLTRNTDDLSIELTPSNGSIVYTADYSMGLTTYTVEITSKTECTGDVLRKFTVTVPLYNEYSNYIICEDIPNFKYCQKYLLEEQPTLQEFKELSDAYIEENNITTKSLLDRIGTTEEE